MPRRRMSGRLVDQQRSRVYNAEHAAFGSCCDTEGEKIFNSVDELERYLEWAFAEFKTAKEFRPKLFAASPRIVRDHWEAVCDSRRTRYDFATRRTGPASASRVRITFPLEPWAWRETIALHELAHFIIANCPWDVVRETEAHGPEFVKLEAALIGEFVGWHAFDRLVAACERRRVRHIPREDRYIPHS